MKFIIDITNHGPARDPEEVADALHDMLCSLPEEYDVVGISSYDSVDPVRE